MKLGNDFFRFLGLAAKAGKCVYGSFACEKLVKSSKAYLIIYDCSLSERSKHDIKCMCEHYSTEMIESEPEYAAGAACGKNNIKIIGIKDKNFKEKLLELSNVRRCDSWQKL